MLGWDWKSLLRALLCGANKLGGAHCTEGVMLVYWIHKASEAAGDRMRLDQRIPLLVSTFKYTSRTEWKCFTFSFLNLRLGLSQPYVWLDEDQWISGVGGLARTPILHWGWSGIWDCKLDTGLGETAKLTTLYFLDWPWKWTFSSHII